VDAVAQVAVVMDHIQMLNLTHLLVANQVMPTVNQDNLAQVQVEVAEQVA
jgi:hypothetical protein